MVAQGVCLLCTYSRLGRTPVHFTEIRDCALFLDTGLFRHEAPAHHHCGTYQRHAPRDGAHWSPARVRRTTERTTVGGRHHSDSVLLPAQCQRTERGDPLFAQPMDLLRDTGRRIGRRQRTVRQVSARPFVAWRCRAGPNDGTRLV